MTGLRNQISYVELLDTTAQRQQALSESYFFTCDCDRCTASQSGTSNDDWFLDGYACPSSGSTACGLNGVVVFHNDDNDASTASCVRCGRLRSLPNRRALTDASDALAKRIRTLAPGPDKWRLSQQHQALLVDELALHPRNTRLAAFYRDTGTWLIDAPATAFPSTSSFRVTTTALTMFTHELTATVWLIPTVKLPARGLLHFQIGKLTMSDDAASDGGRTALETATKHLQHALSMYVSSVSEPVVHA